jgi:hypothetical protein
MTHRMILMSHDFKEVLKVMVAKKKNAGMAEVDMHLTRNEDYSGSTPDSRSTFEQKG